MKDHDIIEYNILSSNLLNLVEYIINNIFKILDTYTISLSFNILIKLILTLNL